MTHRPILPCITLLLACLFASQASAAKIVLVAGGGTGGDGSPATQAKLDSPFGVEFDRDGNLIFVELTGHRVRRIDKRGIVTTLAGTGEKGLGGDGGPAATATFNGMHNLAISPDGGVFLADTWNNCVRRIDPQSGKITTVAGTGQKGFSGDGGPATKAEFGGIYCASLNPDATKLYLADLDNRRIRVVDLKTGIVTTVAGNGQKGAPADGSVATDSPLVDPRAVAVDKAGHVYVLERGGHALRVVSPDGAIRTVVGTGKAGLSGDGGDARQATLNGPKHLCVDHDGTVLIADTENHVVRRYNSATGRIDRVAGIGKRGTAGVGGDPLQIEMNQPHGVFVHSDGTLYITDSSNHRILRIEK